ncbi:MAG: GNAT family N-acetyltransferase [Bacteroidota bacterium]
MPIILQSKNLNLREFTLADTAFIVELLKSESWLEFIGDRNVKNEQDAENYLLNGPLKSYAENGFGLALVETKDDKTPIGMCGLIKRENLDHPDIGFAFLPVFMSKGYAFEISKALMIFARKKLKLNKILAITDPKNKASIKLLEKLDFEFEKKIHFEEEELFLFENV